MMKLFLLFAIFLAIYSAPTNCNFNDNNVLEYFELEETLELLEMKSQILMKPECYNKNICTFTCKSYGFKSCKEIIFIEIPKNSPLEPLYRSQCLDPKQPKLEEIIKTKLEEPLEKAYNQARNLGELDIAMKAKKDCVLKSKMQRVM